MSLLKKQTLIFAVLLSQSIVHASAEDLRADNIKSLKGLILQALPQSTLTEGCSLTAPQKCTSTNGVRISPRYKEYVEQNLRRYQDNALEISALTNEISATEKKLKKTLDESELTDLADHRNALQARRDLLTYNQINPTGISGKDIFGHLDENDDKTIQYHTFAMPNQVNTSQINPYTNLAFAIKSGSEMKMTVKVYAQFPWSVSYDAKSEAEQKLALIEEIDADCVATKNVNNYMFINTRFQFKTSNAGVALNCKLADNRGVLKFWANKRD